MKRLLDIVVAASGLLATLPLVGPILFLVWQYDRKSPIYRGERAGRHGKPFWMVKIRSMSVGADRSGVDSTAANDVRITPVGHFVRRYKLDELLQLWNVLRGDMSLVGPRPNVKRDVALYTSEEQKLLMVRPGITDFASIVFADEGEILRGHADADLRYNQVIRPWKSRLGLLYVAYHSVWIDLRIIWLTVMALISRPSALRGVRDLIAPLTTDSQLLEIVMRQRSLTPHPPPGATDVVVSR